MQRFSPQYNDFYFLRYGGEMGELIRATDWSKTALGDPAQWPQSLRTTVAMMLENPFGMYIAWGSEYIQLYNDAYRPILGSTKHPHAVGISTRETFEEIWHIIGPMFQGVMNGKGVGFPDLMLPLSRNGFVEDCYFDFSYSPIRSDNGEVGGVLVTVIETTNKKKAEAALKESEERFKTMAEASDVLIATSDKTSNATYFNKAWSDLTGRSMQDLVNFGWSDLIYMEDRQRFLNIYLSAFEKRENWKGEFRMLSQDGSYRWLLAKGVVLRQENESFSGYISSSVDITEKVIALKQLEESEQEIRSLIESAPFPIGVYKGREMMVALANKSILDVWGKGDRVIGKLFSEILPELDNQEVFKQLDAVYTSGIPLHIKNQRLDLLVNEKVQPYYFNYSLTPLFDSAGKVYGVMNTGADVTDLNLATQKIQESENKLRNTILQAPIAMCIFIGPKHVVELANDRMFELWGKPAEVLLNKPLFEGLFEAKNQGFEELLDDVYNTGNTVTAQGIPVTLPRNGGIELVYVDILYQAYRDASDSITGILAVAVDVTTQVIARKKIEEAEEKARLAINSAELGVYEISYASDDMITDRRFKEIWGIDYDARRAEFADAIHPDDLPVRNKANAEALHTGQLNYTARVLWKDKSVHWVKVTGKVIYREKGEPLKLIGIIQDITTTVIGRLKIEESERSIRSMILQAPVAMCILRGPSHMVEIANNKMFELWGKQEKEVMGKPIFVGLPEAREQGLEQILQNVLVTGESFAANERPVNLPRNGKIETVFINFVYEALNQGDETIAGILAVAIDVTPQVEARQKIEEVVAKRTKDLAEANNNLQKSNAELAQFAYIASHDLQEPLRKITTFSNMLENSIGDKLDEQSRRFLDKINISSGRMNKMIRDVLAYSELVKDKEVFTDVDLNKTLESICIDYDLLIEEKGAVVRYSNLPVVEAIPLQMSQLFGNLLGNALKFARKDVSPVINISVEKLTGKDLEYSTPNKESYYYKIRFKDNGIGFKEEYGKHIFSIFQRLHGKAEYEGTGIGLAMCKKIALNHQGEIDARGSSENGAVFNLILPVKKNKK